MLSQLRRGHHQHEADGPMSGRAINGHGEHWKGSDRAHSSVLNNNILPDVYPQRSAASSLNPDLSRAFRVNAQLLAIVRIDDKRNAFYSTEVVSKLRQKEQTQSFINKPCSLCVTDRALVIFDRASQVIAETVPLENVDPTCVYSDTPDTLNDIFMYRLHDRFSTLTPNQASRSNSNESSTVIVFKCLNKESKSLVDCIRNANGRPMKNPRSARSETRNTIERHQTDTGRMPFYDAQPSSHDPSSITNPAYVASPQQTARSTTQQQSTVATTDFFKHLTEDLNKCFDDIELFVRYIESLMEYTKELDRDHRRRDKKGTVGLKQMVEKLPEDRFFTDIFQKFKYSFNLLGELKHIIHNPNAPELVHYLLSPLQFIVQTLRAKHPKQLQVAQEVWTPPLTKEARELLLNCLTSKEQEILRNLGPAWIRTAEETPQKLGDYRPVFFEGHPLWFQESPNDQPLPSARTIDQYRPSAWSPVRQSNQNNNNNGPAAHHTAILARAPSPAPHFDASTVDRSGKNAKLEDLNAQMQNEHAWAIDRKQTGAKICAVKLDRKGQNNKELSVRRGELIEIENSSKKWWKARNFHGDVGHVPHNIVEEIEIEQRPAKNPSSNPSASLPRSSSAPHRGPPNVNGRRYSNPNDHKQQLIRSPSHGTNFIMQSNNSTTTNPATTRDHLIQQTISHTSPPPPLPPSIPPPPPPPMPAQWLTSRSSSWSTSQLPESARKSRARADTDQSTPPVDELQVELTQRITDRVGFISPNSSREETQKWLASKHISAGLAKSLNGMTGAELFHLSKDALDRLTDATESARVYTLLSQQKQLAGYRSEDVSERSPVLTTSGKGSLKASTINDADGNLSVGRGDSFSRSLKIKLKQRRDKIEQSELVNRTVL